MPLDVVVPPMGESVIEATLTKWLVKEGDSVNSGQPVASVATDKADTEINAPAAGRVLSLLAAEGDTIRIGAIIAQLEEGAAQAATPKAAAPPAAAPPAAAPPAAPAAEASNGRDASAGFLRATPSVRDLARQMNVDLQQVHATGEAGRITTDDVKRAASTVSHAPSSPPPAAVRPAAPAPQQAHTAAPAPPQAYAPAPAAPSGTAFLPPIPNVGFGSFKVPVYVQKPGDQVVPFSRKRRITADHMVYSKFASPQVVTVAEVDMHRVSLLREQHKDRYKKEGLSLTMLAFACVAVTRALRQHPGLNARVVDGATALLKAVNLGIAVDAPDGLVVPNIKHADELSLRGMARAIGEVAGRARDGKLTADDFSGSTFSVTNPGAKGNLFGGAIISQPNVGILRLGEVKKRVVVVEEGGEDRIAIHPVMYIALTYDHRVVDGVLGNSFLWTVADELKRAEFEP
ncbi:MAG: 2-oxo acid dehydrogenase subunit E2 [Polyangiaceae bacterium]|jgi:2-oxoglutarate dehydrogenase E2 component (dihydrolipoamide succinyltransferase)|nr:2-oxo acid dehydrogenase subunit E2 [Polyangiaceae bacterium]